MTWSAVCANIMATLPAAQNTLRGDVRLRWCGGLDVTQDLTLNSEKLPCGD